MNNDYSVLMPLWHNEPLSFLESSISSMIKQDVLPYEFVFVLDNPIPQEMKNLITSTISNKANIHYIECFHLKGQGLGALLHEGVEACQCPFIARMDSDDISMPHRCSAELDYLNYNSKFDVIGSFLTEFEASPLQAGSLRKVPEQGVALTYFAKFRNPCNHPTVMFKKASIISAGNYNSNYSYCEDYELWYRMIKAGYKFYNIQESLLYYRKGDNFLERRSRKGNIDAYIQLKKSMLNDGFINKYEYFSSVYAQCIFSRSPVWLKKMIYNNLRMTQK